jgi:VWFA-related protein
VKTLAREDVRVLSDGAPRAVFGFEPQANAPLRLALMLDASVSHARLLPAVKAASRDFLSGAIRPRKDLAAVVGFTHEPGVEQGLTGDVEELGRAVERVRVTFPPNYDLGSGIIIHGPPPARGKDDSPMFGSTALWDSLLFVCEKVLTDDPQEERGRRVVLLVSDGVDTSSLAKSDEAVARAVRAGVVVYSIGIADRETTDILGGKAFDPADKGALRKISERTGGRAYFPEKLKDLPAVFAQIREELSSQYAVTFQTPDRPDGSFRKLRVEVVNPELRKQDLRLAYPHGYFAGNTSSPVKK